ncbi:MAG TPA: HDOD domain-containing protein [Candidatus Didemnitutus sp.]|jgi:diguanylate cyclase (GGDEF)-like protein
MSRLTFSALKSTRRLPSPPAIAVRILQLVGADDTTLEELAQVIGADPALTAKIMKYLHSPLIGLGFHGTTLAEAIARIGTRGAQLLALSFSLVSQRDQKACPSFDFDRFWSESLARAVAARRLAARERGWDREEAFIAGLVLRLGRLVLATAVPVEYEALLAAGGAELVHREREAFGLDHLDLGSQLLQDWKLPESICRSVAPFAADEPSEGLSRPVEILRLADRLAGFMAVPADGETGADVLEAATFFLGGDREEARHLIAEMTRDWMEYGELLSIPTPEPPDLDEIELEAEEQRTTLRLAAEIEVLNLRNENQQLTHLANRDRLTGLLNRGAFDEAIRQLTSAARGGLALIMIDLDHFKAINDRHGHPVGDAILRHFARIAHEVVRPPARIFRYGGEEFAVLLTDVSDADALAAAERLRRAMEDRPHQEGSRNLRATISAGVATARWPEAPLSGAGLVARADGLLYEAKRAGGNCCRPDSVAR